MNQPLESFPTSPARPRPKRRPRSPRLAWAITLGEILLLGGAAFPLSKYWLMLPAPIRLGSAAILLALTLLVIFRIFRFHWRRTQSRRHQSRADSCAPHNEAEGTSALTVPSSAPASDPAPRSKRRHDTTFLMTTPCP